MRRIVVLLMAIVMLGCVLTNSAMADSVMVAEALSSNGVEYDGLVAPDLLYFSQDVDTLKIDRLKIDSKNEYNYRKISGEKAGIDVLQAYADLLCAKYDFEYVIPPYRKEISSVISYEFVLAYKGSQPISSRKFPACYNKSAKGDVVIYGSCKRSSLRYSDFCYNQSIQMIDTGDRYGSSGRRLSLVGDSASAALYRNEDGSYTTGDSRMTVSVGEAMVLRDGQAYMGEATFVRNTDKSRDEIYVENYYRNEMVAFDVPMRSMMAGDRFTHEDFIEESSWANDVQDELPIKVWRHTQMFTSYHGGSYQVPKKAMSGDLKQLNIRVLVYEPDAVAVFHIGAQFQTAPYCVEILAAVRMGSGGVVATDSDGEFTVNAGKSLEIKGPEEYGTSFNKWTWSFVSGSEISELANTRSRTCTLTTFAGITGDTRIKVKYEYGKNEPNVLTGILESKSHSTTREYVVHVIP